MNPRHPFLRIFFYASVALIVAACSFAPPYQRPTMPIPTHYKEAGHWIAVYPNLADRTQTEAWWTLFHDPVLNDLERRVTCNNQNLKVAWAKYQEACALAQAARSDFYPTLVGQGNAVRQQGSKTLANVNTPITLFNSFLLGSELTYVVDAWGRVRNTAAASQHLAQASSFDLATVNLSLHAELASDYFTLRGDEAAQRILDKTVRAYQRALFLTRKRFEGGASSEIDLDQAKTQFENARTLATDMRLKRAQLEHAIAVLVGEIPSNFALPSAHSPIKIVTIAPYFPSTLLERRPDVAAQEQRVQAANASIGVARAAFFPDFYFSAFLGAQSSHLSRLLTSPSLYWSIGPNLALSLVQPEVTQIIFDGYRLQALLNRAKAGYFEAVSAYRQTVLTAFQEVEDGLIAIKRIDEENQTQTRSTYAAARALFQANQRYAGGIATYLDVVITENQTLQAELALVTIHTRRQLASVQLIKALGGGWS